MGANIRFQDQYDNTALDRALFEEHADVVSLIKRRLGNEELERRRAIQARVVGKLASLVDFEKPGTNSFFYKMGQGLRKSCTFEEFQESFPDASEQNYHFFLGGCN